MSAQWMIFHHYEITFILLSILLRILLCTFTKGFCKLLFTENLKDTKRTGWSIVSVVCLILFIFINLMCFFHYRKYGLSLVYIVLFYVLTILYFICVSFHHIYNKFKKRRQFLTYLWSLILIIICEFIFVIHLYNSNTKFRGHQYKFKVSSSSQYIRVLNTLGVKQEVNGKTEFCPCELMTARDATLLPFYNTHQLNNQFRNNYEQYIRVQPDSTQHESLRNAEKRQTWWPQCKALHRNVQLTPSVFPMVTGSYGTSPIVNVYQSPQQPRQQQPRQQQPQQQQPQPQQQPRLSQYQSPHRYRRPDPNRRRRRRSRSRSNDRYRDRISARRRLFPSIHESSSVSA